MKLFVFLALLALTQAAFTGDINAFCNTLVLNCTGNNLQYSTAADCVTAMNSGLVATPGSDGDTSGDSKACRVYHGGAAQSDANTHCIHAGSTGGDACGTLTQVYCDQLFKVCPNEATTQMSECTTIAGVFPKGTISDTSGNTLFCRLYHVKAAVLLNDTVTHCPHVAPSGGGVCGSWCEDYCQLVTTACTGANQQYSSAAACMSICPSFTTGVAGDTSGNTVACRAYHARVALNDPATHCIHAGPEGAPGCGTSACDSFCSMIQYGCTGALAQYTDAATCKTECAKWAPGTIGDTSGNTLGCRVYHIGVAISTNGTTTHCPHGSASGGGVCVGSGLTSASPNPNPSPSSNNAGKLFALALLMLIVIFI